MNLSAILDPRTGIIRRIERNTIAPTLPPEFFMVTAVLSDTTRFSAWASDFAGAGYALLDESAAIGPAVGEAVERYCGNLVPAGLRRATFAELTASGCQVVDPRSVVLFSPTQYGSPRFPFVEFSEDFELEWVCGTQMPTGAVVWVPANLVWVSYAHRAPARRVPFLNPVLSSGLAAGVDEAGAQWSALCQMVERDALTMAWHGRRPLREVIPPPWLAQLGAGAQGSLTTRFIEFPNEFGMIVIGALVFDETSGHLSMGAACRTTAEPAMRKALAEAFQLQMFVGDLDDPDGSYMRAARRPDSPLKRWRADRFYLDDCRDDLADIVEYCTHLQLFLDPRMQDRLEAELADSITGTVTWESLDTGAPFAATTDPLILAETLARAGHPVVSVDVTTEDVRPTGMRVVHTLAPGLYSNSSVGLPFRGGTRLAEQLAAVGKPRRDFPLPH
ncbi:YcaO-like family protein [Candidatus Protofrankia californiensis]|uniref:YcaO-like family protein n=1 Tax=Candidatus Protofrankia californiensis TaxID=1839754 RepID=UPI0010415C6F|nr:YcaO-like family protein [Candidatus Protofrankia californiensis]